MESKQEGAPIVYQHDCIQTNQKQQRPYAQQVLSFRHQAICNFGIEGIGACLCGNFHDENKLSVVRNKEIVLDEDISEMSQADRKQLLHGLLVLYCSEAKMFYPICLDKSVEGVIKKHLVDSPDRISYILFQSNMEGPNQEYTHFYESPGNYSGDADNLP